MEIPLLRSIHNSESITLFLVFALSLTILSTILTSVWRHQPFLLGYISNKNLQSSGTFVSYIAYTSAKAAHYRGDITKSPKHGYQCPRKRHMSAKKFLKSYRKGKLNGVSGDGTCTFRDTSIREIQKIS